MLDTKRLLPIAITVAGLFAAWAAVWLLSHSTSAALAACLALLAACAAIIAVYSRAADNLQKQLDSFLWLHTADLSALLDYQPESLNIVPVESREVVRRVEKAVAMRYSNELLKKQIEYSTLQSQINPHFLYNTLDSLRGKALVNGQDDIAEMLERISRFFRYSISSRKEFVKLEDELDNVQDYFFIQQFRFSDRLSLQVKIEDPTVRNLYVPKLTLQPIVENAINHGLEQVAEDGRITIRVMRTDKNLRIVLADNGAGIEESRMMRMNESFAAGDAAPAQAGGESGTGIGLHNVNSRIRLLGGKDYGLRIHSTLGQGTDVMITLPCVEHLPAVLPTAQGEAADA